MATLWLDCDDTLVIWLDEDGQPLEGQNPYGGGSQRWKWNEELIRAIDWVSDWDLAIWSGGGAQYAARWRDLLRWDLADAYSKDTRLPQPNDLCVDDMPLKVACEVMTWQEFVGAGPIPDDFKSPSLARLLVVPDA